MEAAAAAGRKGRTMVNWNALPREQLESMAPSGLEYRAAFLDETRLTEIEHSGLDDDDLLEAAYAQVKRSMGFGTGREYPNLKAKIKIGTYSEK